MGRGEDKNILRGVPGTALGGLWGRPFLPLDEVLADVGVALDDLAAVHDEICLAYASLPVDYTGGSHRSMGIMPPSRQAEAVVDYLEVLRALSPADWQSFVSLADDPADGPAKTFLARTRRLAADPPVADWDGVWRLTEK